ncbi:hypothetical protein F4861DRAFT_534559 [Xylaria intraflava]|nr:hypothetical protein F4861DRAFT_534559 [Xylaria intraflava]
MVTNAQTQDLRENLRLRSDLVFSLPGTILRISFYVRFAERNAARLALSANDEQLRVVSALNYGPGGDANGTGNSSALNPRSVRGGGSDKRSAKEGLYNTLNKTEIAAPGGEWTQITFDYTAHDRLLQLTFSYQLDSAPGNTMWLDQVSISPSNIVHPPLSPPPSPAPATTFATAFRAAARWR